MPRVCFELSGYTQQSKEGENEAAKVHIAANEGQPLQMSGRKSPRGIKVLSEQAVFFPETSTK